MNAMLPTRYMSRDKQDLWVEVLENTRKQKEPSPTITTEISPSQRYSRWRDHYGWRMPWRWIQTLVGVWAGRPPGSFLTLRCGNVFDPSVGFSQVSKLLLTQEVSLVPPFSFLSSHPSPVSLTSLQKLCALLSIITAPQPKSPSCEPLQLPPHWSPWDHSCFYHIPHHPTGGLTFCEVTNSIPLLPLPLALRIKWSLSFAAYKVLSWLALVPLPHLYCPSAHPLPTFFHLGPVHLYFPLMETLC